MAKKKPTREAEEEKKPPSTTESAHTVAQKAIEDSADAKQLQQDQPANQQEPKKVPFFKNLKNGKTKTVVAESDGVGIEEVGRTAGVVSGPKESLFDTPDDGVVNRSGQKHRPKEETTKDSGLQSQGHPERQGGKGESSNDSRNDKRDAFNGVSVAETGGSVATEDINLLDQVDYTIPQKEDLFIDDDLMNVNFQKVEGLDSSRAEEDRGQVTRTSNSFLRKLKESRGPRDSTEGSNQNKRRDESSILEKIEKNLKDFSENSADDSVDNSRSRESFMERVTAAFKLDQLEHRMTERVAVLAATVHRMFVFDGEGFEREKEREAAESRARDKIGELERRLEECVVAEDYDRAEQVQRQIDSVKESLVKTDNDSGKKSAQTKQELDEATAQLAEELRKTNEKRMLVKEKLIFHGENESAQYELIKRKLNEEKDRCRGDMEAVTTVLREVGDKVQAVSDSVSKQTEEEQRVLEAKNTRKATLMAQIDRLKMELTERENQLHVVMAEAAEAESRVARVRSSFEPRLNQLVEEKSRHEQRQAEVTKATERQRVEEARNEEHMQLTRKEMAQLEESIAAISGARQRRSDQLESLSSLLWSYSESVKQKQVALEQMERVKASVELKSQSFETTKQEIKFTEIEVENLQNEVKKASAKMTVLENQKTEAVRNKNFAQAKHFSTELKDLQDWESAKREAVTGLLAVLDAKRRELPGFESQAVGDSEELRKARVLFLKSELDCCEKRKSVVEVFRGEKELEESGVMGQLDALDKRTELVRMELNGLGGGGKEEAQTETDEGQGKGSKEEVIREVTVAGAKEGQS